MIGILLINLGSPEAPTTGAVRRYLRQFLMDPRVIDVPALPRWLLVNMIIAPFRAPRSAEAYRKIWDNGESPLLQHSFELVQQVRKHLGPHYVVELGMRYGRPSIEAAMRNLIRHNAKEIRVLPLYPQYAASSTGSAVAEAFRVAHRIWDPPKMSILHPFYDHPGFTDVFAAQARSWLSEHDYDRVLFTFHGLPERHIHKSDPTQTICLKETDCCEQENPHNHYCYRHQCFVTAKGIASDLGLARERYAVSFQSRLGRDPWLTPHTDKLLEEMPGQGVKKLLVFCPSFVADCLETLEEIGIRGRQAFLKAGGERLDLVPCPNGSAPWAEVVADMVRHSHIKPRKP